MPHGRVLLGSFDTTAIAEAVRAEGRRRQVAAPADKRRVHEPTPDEMMAIAAAMAHEEVVERGEWILDFVPLPDNTRAPGLQGSVSIDAGGAVYIEDAAGP